jgi:hypothetical protein
MLLRDWLAITVGSHVWAWRRLDSRELAHEMAHVRQWRRYGVAFVLRYVAASIGSWVAGTGWYRGNRFEIEARAAAAESGACRGGRERRVPRRQRAARALGR